MPDKKYVECDSVEETDNGGQRKISFGRAPYFQKHYATRVGVSRTEFDIRLEMMNEKFKDEDNQTDVFVIDQMVILTPLAAKELSEQLHKIVIEWEKSSPIQPRPDKSIYAEFKVE